MIQESLEAHKEKKRNDHLSSRFPHVMRNRSEFFFLLNRCILDDMSSIAILSLPHERLRDERLNGSDVPIVGR